MSDLPLVIILIAVVVSLIVGYVIANVLAKKAALAKEQVAGDKAKIIIREAEAEAEVLKKNKILEAKEKFLQLKTEHEKVISEKDKNINSAENRIKQKETALAQKIEQTQKKEKEYETLQANLKNQLDIIEGKKEELGKQHQRQVEQLEKISGLSVDQAKSQLVEALKAEAKTDAMSYIKDIMEEAKLTASKESKKIIIQTIQRVATEHAVENAVTIFNIENDEVKGRIIGREGRNIRALEAATGVEIIVDDTPETIILSGFDPVRREMARLALHQLVSDGRIHPARIEEVVAKVKRQLEDEIVEIGKRTTIDLGIHGLAPELIRMIGRMKYRSSYGQNLLQHSREVANLCAIMAAELGLNVKDRKSVV